MSASLRGPRLGASVALRARTNAINLRAPLQASHERRRLQISAALHDPWATLGVSRDASEKEVKQAHRRLVKQHHPDVRKAEDLVAQAQFLRIQEAYELIMGKRAGKDVDGRPTEKGGWDFHDWFWSFKMKRKQGVREQAATFRSQWQAQMAGLKQKAAAKRSKVAHRRPPAAANQTAGSAHAAAAGTAAAAEGPASSSAARERVWRSMTKNARNTDKAAAERTAAQQTLDGTRRSAPQAVGAGSQQPPKHAAQEAPRQRSQQQQQHHQPEHTGGAASHHRHHSAADEAASHSHTSSSSSHAARLRQLMEHAMALVQGRQQWAGGHAPAAHAAHALAKDDSHAAPGHHWRGHVTLDQLASLLGGGSAGNAVPADQQLHRHFEAARRAQQGQHGAAAGHAEAAVAEDELQAEAEAQHAHQQQYEHHHQQHYGGAHERKFANRGDVEERINTQLAGLKRRAALKQEVQSSC